MKFDHFNYLNEATTGLDFFMRMLLTLIVNSENKSIDPRWPTSSCFAFLMRNGYNVK